MDPQVTEEILVSNGEADGIIKDTCESTNFSTLKTELTDSPVSVLEDEVKIIYCWLI